MQETAQPRCLLALFGSSSTTLMFEGDGCNVTVNQAHFGFNVAMQSVIMPTHVQHRSLGQTSAGMRIRSLRLIVFRIGWLLVAVNFALRAASQAFVANGLISSWTTHCSPPLVQRGAEAEAQAESAPTPSGNPVIRVGRSTEIKKLAGAIKARILEFGETKVGCIGKDSVNLALKGVVMTNKYLDQDRALTGKKLAVFPSFDDVPSLREESTIKALFLTVRPALKSVAEGYDLQTPRNVSKDALFAGAIKKYIREGGVCKVKAMGADRANRAIKAVHTATLYLRSETENDALELGAFPAFETLPRSSGEDFSQLVLTAFSTCPLKVKRGRAQIVEEVA